MNNRIEILNELKNISPTVATIPFVNVYSVSADYFEHIEAENKARIIADTFSKIRSKNDVPIGYFENLADDILSKIKNQPLDNVLNETNSISTAVANIGNKNVYNIPQYYFENIVFSANKLNPVKVISIKKNSYFFKYAAAAVITGIIALGVLKYTNNTTQKLDEPTTVALKAANNIIKTNSFDVTLQTISDKDLENYLSQNGDDVNAGLVASTINETNNLPDVDDYLNDENTLDNYLKSNNLKN